MRRAFISGFTGSAGTAVVTREKAALWTDGRYFLQVPTYQILITLNHNFLCILMYFSNVYEFFNSRFCHQAEKELGQEWILMRSGNNGVPTTGEWLNDVLTPGSRIGIDPVSLLYFLIPILFILIYLLSWIFQYLALSYGQKIVAEHPYHG